jgi:hypothetical protein
MDVMVTKEKQQRKDCAYKMESNPVGTQISNVSRESKGILNRGNKYKQLLQRNKLTVGLPLEQGDMDWMKY